MTEPIPWKVYILPHRAQCSVTCTLTMADQDRFYLPAWIPGSYLIREFIRGVQDLVVQTLDGQDVMLERVNKASWRVRLASPTKVRIRYTVYGHELSVRSAHIDHTHAFFNGANVFMCFESKERERHSVHIDAPPTWHSFVSLPQENGAFVADGYELLADTAFEIGPHPFHTFTIQNVPHRIIAWGHAGVLDDLTALEAPIRDLVLENQKTWDAPLPYERYDFIFHITPDARGGLEHRNGTTLATPWGYFNDPEQRPDLLSLIAHEHFHSYNGRRLAPQSLQHIDFESENYTEELWVIEGFTSYFDELNTYRAGGMTRDQWLKRTGEALTRLQGIHGRTRQSLTASSYDAWIRLYRPYEHTRNQTVSYYLKGSLVAMAIDLLLRETSGGSFTLETILRELWTDWRDKQVHYTTRSVLQKLADKLPADAASAVERWVTSTDAVPYERLLHNHGIGWETVPSKPMQHGLAFAATGEAAVIQSIDEAMSDALSGLLPGDELVAINGLRVFRHTIGEHLQACAHGDETHVVTLFRLGRLHTVSIRIPACTSIQLTVDASAAPAVQKLRDSWLWTKKDTDA